ncbi:RHS repeat-associated core domain-containing protein [Streptomyces phaeolivaceus]|nr:RHS repeat-associated core domain-containing protein [Streptomyces phaeolivaceus]
MTLKQRQRQVQNGRFKAPIVKEKPKQKTEAEAIAEAERSAARAQSLAASEGAARGISAAEGEVENPAGGPTYIAVVGPEGSYRSLVGASPGGTDPLVGQVFEGETLLASAEIIHSDYAHDGDNKLIDVLHQVKVTWEVSCGPNTVEYDLGQVVTAHSHAYSLVHSLSGPVVTLETPVDPEQCADVVPNQGNFSVMALATVVDVATGRTGAVVTGMSVTPGIPDEQTYGCATECASLSTAFPQPQAQRGASVNTATGAFSGVFTDAQQPSVGGGLDLTRRYSSDNTGNGSLGKGWTLPWDAKLVKDAGGNVTYTSESGAKHPYTKKSDGTYASPVTSRSALKSLADGTYTLATPDKRKLTFDADGRLTSDKNRSGQGVTYRYTGGHLDTVTDAAGRVSTATYSGGALTSMQLADGLSVDYGYTGGQLTSVTGTDGKQVTYGYDGGGRLESIQDAAKHYPVRNTYDAQGRVITQKDALGKETTYTYRNGETDTTAPDGGVWTDVYAHNYLLVQYDPFGNRTFYNYDNTANVTRVTDALGNATRYSYGANGFATSETSAVGAVWRFAYTNGNLTKVTDAEANPTTYTYRSDGLLDTAKDAAGNITTFTYTATGQLASQTDPLKNTTSYGYDAAGNVTSVRAPSGATTTYAYDASGQVTSTTDPRGNAADADPQKFTTTYTYDAAGRLDTTTDARGNTTDRDYDAAGNLTQLKDAEGGTTTYTYDAANRLKDTMRGTIRVAALDYDSTGRVISSTDATGARTTYTYDKAGRVETMTTPRGNVTGADPADYTWRYGYDRAGNQLTVTDPLGNTTATAYTADYRPATVTDPLGNTQKYTYDDMGNILRSTDALSRTTINTYNDYNQLATVRDRAGNTTAYTYDEAGRLKTETSPLGNKTTYAYNADGRLTDTVEPRGNIAGADPAQYTWHTSYDAAGNITGTTDPLGNATSRTYDSVNNLIRSGDGRKNATEYEYDKANRLTRVQAPDQGRTALSYDELGNLKTRTDANQHVTAYEYDKTGRLTKITDPLKRATSFGYDADGNRTLITNARGQKQTSAYNARNQLTSITYSDATPSVSYTYDNAGRIATVTDGTGTRSLTYDAENRPLTITSPGATNPFKYTYNNDGTIKSRTYPDGYAISYAYDTDGRIKSQTTAGKTITYGWDEAGNLLSTQLPTTTALAETRTYDRAGRLASISQGTGARHLTRDADGRVITDQFKDSATTGLASRYAYDGVGRLTRTCTDTSAADPCLDGPNGTTYSYDKVGNLTTSKTGTTVVTNDYDAADQLIKRVAGTATTNFGYDTDGNLTKDAVGTYTYDSTGRVKSATIGADSFTFGYDADGNRTTANKNGKLDRTTRWDVNNPLPQIATETNATGGLIADYNYNPAGIPQAVNQTTGVFYLLHDRQESVRAVHDSTGKETYTYTYTPWGETTGKASTTNGQTSAFGYTGQYKDPYLTGRLALRARSYDPTTARFSTTDPVPADVRSANLSPYAYANNDPANLADASGLCPLCISAGIGAAFGAVLEGGIYTWQHRNDGFTWGGLAKATGKGALTGAVAGALMPGAGNAVARGLGFAGGRALATSTVVNAGVGAAFSWGVNEVHCRPTGPWDLIAGAAGGGSSSLLGPAFSWLKNRLFMPRITVSAHTNGGPRTFPNHYDDPAVLARELADASAAGVAPIPAGTQAFDEAVTKGGEYLWAVGANGQLRIIPNVSGKIKHAVLFNGEPVQGAGSVQISNGAVTFIDDQSGHYYPWLEDNVESFLKVGVDAFRNAGIHVPDEAIKPFGW